MSVTALQREVKKLRAAAKSRRAPKPQQQQPLPFADFLDNVFLSAIGEIEGQLAAAPHLASWAELLERHRFAAIIAFRGSLKSTVLKALIAYELYRHDRGAFDAILFSAKLDLARWHLRRLKLYLDGLAPRWDWRDATQGEALLRYERSGAVFSCEPEGLDAAARGRRADLLVIDDPCDPRKLASFADIERSLEALQRRILPLLKDKRARVVLAATPIVQGDIVSWVERNSEFVCTRLPALDDSGTPTWPEKYPKEELERIRRLIGEKAFAAEYLLQAVAPMESYIDSTVLDKAIAKIQIPAR